MAKRDFLITVDVEALPGRGDDDLVNKVIWGNFGTREQAAGIGEMVSAGNATGVPFTFFLDMVETELYGDDIREVARYLHESGHDLELHLHPELLQKSFWHSAGIVPKRKLQEYFELDAARAVMKHFSDELRSASGKEKIWAYRAGSFRVGRSMLIAQHEEGIPISSSLSYESFLNQRRVPLAPPDSGPFPWREGPVEVPITQVRRQAGWKVLSMPMRLEGGTYDELFAKMADAPDRSPIVMILHSWSLLKRAKESKTMTGPAPAKVEMLAEVCTSAAKHFNPISTERLAKRILAGEAETGSARPFPDRVNQFAPVLRDAIQNGRAPA